MGLGLLWRDEQDAVELVDLDELDLDALVAGGGEVLAEVVRADRELAVAAVGEHRQLDALGPAVVEKRVDRGADRTAGVEDVVDEDARHSLEREVEAGRADERLRMARCLSRPDVDVVAVEGDVELPECDLGARDLDDPPAEPLRERHAARVDADERHTPEVGVSLDDLVGDPGQGALDRLGIENDFRFKGVRGQPALRALLTRRLLSGLTGPS
jgi:hypothetical protein